MIRMINMILRGKIEVRYGTLSLHIQLKLKMRSDIISAEDKQNKNGMTSDLWWGKIQHKKDGGNE